MYVMATSDSGMLCETKVLPRRDVSVQVERTRRVDPDSLAAATMVGKLCPIHNLQHPYSHSHLHPSSHSQLTSAATSTSTVTTTSTSLAHSMTDHEWIGAEPPLRMLLGQHPQWRLAAHFGRLWRHCWHSFWKDSTSSCSFFIFIFIFTTFYFILFFIFIEA